MPPAITQLPTLFFLIAAVGISSVAVAITLVYLVWLLQRDIKSNEVVPTPLVLRDGRMHAELGRAEACTALKMQIDRVQSREELGEVCRRLQGFKTLYGQCAEYEELYAQYVAVLIIQNGI